MLALTRTALNVTRPVAAERSQRGLVAGADLGYAAGHQLADDEEASAGKPRLRQGLQINHHVLLLHGHWNRLGDVGALHDALTLGHLHRVAAE